MLTITVLLLLGAFVLTLASAAGKAPLWCAVLLVVVVELLRFLPIA